MNQHTGQAAATSLGALGVIGILGLAVSFEVADNAERSAYVSPELPSDNYVSSYHTGWDNVVISIQKEIFMAYGVAVPEEVVEDAFLNSPTDLELFTAEGGDTLEHYGVSVDQEEKTVALYRNGEVMKPIR